MPLISTQRRFCCLNSSLLSKSIDCVWSRENVKECKVTFPMAKVFSFRFLFQDYRLVHLFYSMNLKGGRLQQSCICIPQKFMRSIVRFIIYIINYSKLDSREKISKKISRKNPISYGKSIENGMKLYEGPHRHESMRESIILFQFISLLS